jgi:alkylated DNA repair dioxygenase AlkB
MGKRFWLELGFRLIMILGLEYIPNFVSNDEELALISVIDSQPWVTDIKRRTQHYGYKYDYTRKTIDSDLYIGPLPNWLELLSERLVSQNIFLNKSDQVIINEYLPGQGISRHVDCVTCFGDTIASISLGSACAMDLEHRKSTKRGTIMLAPLSLLAMKSEARYDWMHSIPARKQDNDLVRTRRVSLTFRNIII